MAKNAIVGQSGGPTSVINSSLAGVYESCKRRGAGKVYGMLHGVAAFVGRDGRRRETAEHNRAARSRIGLRRPAAYSYL